MPDWTLSKHNIRLCAHGGMQQWGVNYWETYAPVVNWISIRFLLVISEVVGLESKAIDFVLAFPQADLDVPVYMEIPMGMEIPNSEYRSPPAQKSRLNGLPAVLKSVYREFLNVLFLRGKLVANALIISIWGEHAASKIIIPILKYTY